MRSLDLIAAHLVGDYILQDDEMARRKLTDARARAHHVTRYCLPFLVAGVVSRVNPGRLAVFLALVWVTHFVTDSKRWLPNEDWAPGTIINDQALHIAQLTILNRIVGRSEW
jgi:hypothetical protein